MNTLRFTVHGRPQPAGSKRAFANRKTGRVHVVDDNANAKPWQQQVAAVALEAAQGRVFARGTPVQLDVLFVLERPAGHFGTGRNRDQLKPSAPARPTTKPDTTKLLRGLEDAMTAAGVWHDDSQVVIQTASKAYGWPQRVEVTARALLTTVGALGEAA
jgi:Holliday junction resolvase RusA-like endonuclease